MLKRAKAQVTINAIAQKTLLLDVYTRRRIEACGLLTGHMDKSDNWHVEQVHPLRNIFDSPVYFEFAPEEVLAVELDHPGQIVGAYHSHPGGLAVASSTDRQNMRRVNIEQRIPWVWLIISGPFEQPFLSLYAGQHYFKRKAGPSIIAYHHYEYKGLRQVNIVFDEGSQNGPDTL